MFVRRAYIPDHLTTDIQLDSWPFTVPVVAKLAGDGLGFQRPITFLVGENGSGKSTLVEAIAEAYGLDAHGGKAGRKYVNDRPKTPLGEILRLESSLGMPITPNSRSGKAGYFLRAETAFGFMNAVSGMRGYWEEDTSQMSHGEGFMTVIDAMFQEPGLYVMDEPEAALSFISCMRLVGLMHQLGNTGAQVICATHSPILASTPGADIIEVGDHGYHRVEWQDMELVEHWRQYLNNPESYLRHFISKG